MASPVVTIGLPFWNAAGTLTDALRSVFSQSFSDWELILLDDGSVDGSLEIARSVRDQRVRVLSDGAHRTLPIRLNQIAEAARGSYIARMDADDLMHPERLRVQIEYLGQHPEVEVVGTAAYTVDTALRVTGFRGARQPCPANILRSRFFLHPSVTGRADWFRSNPYSPEFPRAEDLELWCRTYQRSVFGQLKTPLLYYREVGAFALPKYLRSCRLDRRVYHIYGPSMVGVPGTLLMIGRSWAKSAVYTFAAGLGVTSLLVRRRSQRLTAQQRGDALAGLKRILLTPVPGLHPSQTR